MDVLIIYKSYHQMNTEKVATVMAETMNATLKKAGEVGPEDLARYDLIGIGSGIYGGKHHKDLFTLVEKIPRMEKDVFIFSTSGKPQEKYDQALKEALIGKGCRIVGIFRCPGAVKMLFTLSNKGHPNDEDLENARAFAKSLMSG
jgi:flavodoxin